MGTDYQQHLQIVQSVATLGTAQVTFYLIVQFLWFISIQDNFSDINGNIVSVSAHYHVKQS